ncbi:MAG: Gfo/Idh/MocA family protein [Pseudomonadota bacterium]
MGVHAIIGCGRVAGFHVTAAEASGIEVGYFVDPELDKAHSLAAKFNTPAKCVEDPMEAITDPSVTSASVCVPHWLHTELARSCLENGVDVIVEKPFGLNSNQIAELSNLSKLRKRKLLVCYQHSFDPIVRRGLELLASDAIGRLVFANANCFCRRDAAYYSGWRGTLVEEGGSALINQGIHSLHLLCEAVPDLTCTAAQIQTVELAQIIETEETLTALLSSEYGTMGTLCCSNVTGKEWSASAQFVGTAGQIDFHIGSGNRLVINGDEFVSAPPDGVNLSDFPSSYYGWNHVRLFRSFFSNNEAAQAKIDQTMRIAQHTLSVVEKAYEHARK